MEEKERELMKKAWCFLTKETTAGKGFKAKNIVIGDVPGKERLKEKQETA